MLTPQGPARVRGVPQRAHIGGRFRVVDKRPPLGGGPSLPPASSRLLKLFEKKLVNVPSVPGFRILGRLITSTQGLGAETRHQRTEHQPVGPAIDRSVIERQKNGRKQRN